MLLDLPDRPPAYEDVGRACTWDDLFPPALLARSRYERVLRCALARAPLRLFGRRLKPVGMRGWGEVVFADRQGRRWYVLLDALVPQLPRWGERPAGGGLGRRGHEPFAKTRQQLVV